MSGPQFELLDLDGSDGTAERRAAIVLGHDRSPGSREALTTSLDLARRLAAHLHVVHAVQLRDYPTDPDRHDWEERARRTLAAEQAEVREALRAHEWGWTYQIGRGGPANLLINVAAEHNALMIIVGSRGEGLHIAIERLLTTSVSHRLIEHANRPVLVVRRREVPAR